MVLKELRNFEERTAITAIQQLDKKEVSTETSVVVEVIGTIKFTTTIEHCVGRIETMQQRISSEDTSQRHGVNHNIRKVR